MAFTRHPPIVHFDVRMFAKPTEYKSTTPVVFGHMSLRSSEYLTSTDSGKLTAEPSQIISPPISQASTPTGKKESISVSTTFYPGANLDERPVDLIIISFDSVFFYIHSAVVLSASNNGFSALLQDTAGTKERSDSETVVTLPENASILNILLHTVYGLSCSHYCPSFVDLSTAVSALKNYRISLTTHIMPSAPLFSTLLQHASTSPLELYALAASNDLYHLAVATSPHLLSFSLPSLSDEMAALVGPTYLKRLFFLHLGRVDALKRLLLLPPDTHSPTPTCDYGEQKNLTRAWALASAYLAWDARPGEPRSSGIAIHILRCAMLFWLAECRHIDMSASMIETALRSLGDQLSCNLCKNALTERTNNLILQWSAVKTTI